MQTRRQTGSSRSPRTPNKKKPIARRTTRVVRCAMGKTFFGRKLAQAEGRRLKGLSVQVKERRKSKKFEGSDNQVRHNQLPKGAIYRGNWKEEARKLACAPQPTASQA